MSANHRHMEPKTRFGVFIVALLVSSALIGLGAMPGRCPPPALECSHAAARHQPAGENLSVCAVAACENPSSCCSLRAPAEAASPGANSAVFPSCPAPAVHTLARATGEECGYLPQLKKPPVPGPALFLQHSVLLC
jgi:hypothetical protein